MSDIKTKHIIQTLQYGTLTLVGQALRGSNSTFLTQVADKNYSVQAIYKPSRGERPLWDFPDFTLAQREVAAFIVSHLLGWNLVPATVFRVQPATYGKGSLQLFIKHDPTKHYLNAPINDQIQFMKIAIFDLIINNADRKSGHVIFDSDNKPWLIDHGLCFNHEFKHRTVIWDYAGLSIPDDLKSEIQNFIKKMQSGKLRLVRKLNMLLSELEITTLINRGLYLINQAEFPHPEPNRRSYPWPPI
ncbi:MAG: hypothetical protein K0B14_11250 [Anaerolineaceae bacterium]|nr:hypothetical protein [Anaerolineaceae bacterium]